MTPRSTASRAHTRANVCSVFGYALAVRRTPSEVAEARNLRPVPPESVSRYENSGSESPCLMITHKRHRAAVATRQNRRTFLPQSGDIGGSGIADAVAFYGYTGV